MLVWVVGLKHAFERNKWNPNVCCKETNMRSWALGNIGWDIIKLIINFGVQYSFYKHEGNKVPGGESD